MDKVSQLHRPSLGQRAAIGSLYNLRNDTFIQLSPNEPALSPGTISHCPSEERFVSVYHDKTYLQKFATLGISDELGGTVLARLITPTGSWCYINQPSDMRNYHQTALRYTLHTGKEQVDLGDERVKNAMEIALQKSPEATHMVIGIELGYQSFVVARQLIDNASEESCNTPNFQAAFDLFVSMMENKTQEPNFQAQPIFLDSDGFDIALFSDMLKSEGISLSSFDDAFKVLELMPSYVAAITKEKGVPISYALLPIEVLAFFRYSLPRGMPPTGVIEPLHIEISRNAIERSDKFHVQSIRLADYWRFLCMHRSLVPSSVLEDISQRLTKLQKDQLEWNEVNVMCLQALRGSPESISIRVAQIRTMLQPFKRNGARSPEIITNFRDRRKVVQFLANMIEKGAEYQDKDTDIADILHNDKRPQAYVFRFDSDAMDDASVWDANQKLLLDLMNGKTLKPPVRFIVQESRGTDTSRNKVTISHYVDGSMIIEDLVEERRFLLDRSLARYAPDSLETIDIKKPLSRRFVKSKCPCSECKNDELHEWICSKCKAGIEYGFTDKYIYCDCGRTLCFNWDFKGHGHTKYTRYGSEQKLLSILENLDESNQMNILILGETGVGKSTFINAFLNYVTFESLDEAMATSDLNYLIPCSFSIQTMDRSQSEITLQHSKVEVGSRGDESDGSRGDSATQQTTVYPVAFGSSILRLIDTPGIGDTRGIDFDRKNMADILTTLNSYDKLHGIIILLKSNNSRLTATFSFCVKELLTHLHRDAADNMVFGFTNTRLSNYTPGDTYGPLDTLLKQHPDVGLSLTGSTIYCFDSESFRYLAASKNGVKMENHDDFLRSWDHSRMEAMRLIEYFLGKKPHRVKSTIDLNGLRQIISQLAKPMTEISQLIRTNISLYQD